MANTNTDHEKCCLTCGAQISGRKDKKFCDDYCRSMFNNKVVAPNDRAKRRKLIKAAPELLKALEGLLTKAEPLIAEKFGNSVFDTEVQAAKAAIQKAA